MKILALTALIIATSLSTAQARVSFITEPPDGDASYGVVDSPYKGKVSETSTQTKCAAEGYVRTTCGDGFHLSSPCPHDKKYYKTCCSDDYALTSEQCRARGGIPSAMSCGDKHKCSAPK